MPLPRLSCHWLRSHSSAKRDHVNTGWWAWLKSRCRGRGCRSVWVITHHQPEEGPGTNCWHLPRGYDSVVCRTNRLDPEPPAHATRAGYLTCLDIAPSSRGSKPPQNPGGSHRVAVDGGWWGVAIICRRCAWVAVKMCFVRWSACRVACERWWLVVWVVVWWAGAGRGWRV